MNINWDEYKHYKATEDVRGDNFDILLSFLKSYYNMSSPVELFETLKNDNLSQMMLEKREIADPSSLESYIRTH
jgi:hypothetical protein